ncbi:hypothetical protein [Pseudaestuariivita sp.]|uniref:hypothetical protein n=1 Tax=Pseudaestuariivita sp. TaxID=2211669 RepID=UPI004059CE33
MSANQILNMALRMVMRRGMNAAVGAGVRAVKNRQNAGPYVPVSDADLAERDRIRAERRARRIGRSIG